MANVLLNYSFVRTLILWVMQVILSKLRMQRVSSQNSRHNENLPQISCTIVAHKTNYSKGAKSPVVLVV